MTGVIHLVYYEVATNKIMQVRVKENKWEFGRCGCGRSPTGKCIGWHGLSDDDYQQAIKEYRKKQEKENKEDDASSGQI